MNVPADKDHDVNGHSPACGLVWLTIGGLILALSMLSVNEQPLREAVVYGAQGVIVSLYGWYRLRRARPAGVRAGSATRSGRERVHTHPRGARGHGQIPRRFSSCSG